MHSGIAEPDNRNSQLKRSSALVKNTALEQKQYCFRRVDECQNRHLSQLVDELTSPTKRFRSPPLPSPLSVQRQAAK
jgi:hypothetical protein